MADTTLRHDATDDFSTSVYERLRIYIENDFFHKLESHARGIGPGSGRGRPSALPDMPAKVVTNQFLLQLGLLRSKLQMSWGSLGDIAEKLLSQKFGKDLPQLCNLVMKTLQKVPCCAEDIKTFLAAERDFKFPANAPFCRKYGVTRAFLLGKEEDCVVPPPTEVIPHGLVLELDKFKTENYLTWSAVMHWLQVFCPFQISVNAKELANQIGAIKAKYKKHLKAKTRRPQELSDFQEENFASCLRGKKPEVAILMGVCDGPAHVSVPLTAVASSGSNSVPDSLNTGQGQFTQCQNHLADSDTLTVENRRLTCNLREKDEQLQQQQDELEAIKEICVNQQLTVTSLNKSLIMATNDAESANAALAATGKKLQQKTKDCAALCRNANNVQRAKAALHQRLNGQKEAQQRLQETEERVQHLKQGNTALKKEVEKKRQIVQVLRGRLQDRKEEINHLNQINSDLMLQQIEQPQLVLRDDRGHFTDGVKTCTIQLMGECDVAAAKVGRVMQTVSNNLLGQDVQLNQLPSKSSALRFADIGHALSRIQILEELTHQKFDLHVDGTSRDHKKVLGHQVTLEDRKQLSLGFTPVDREDATTLLDITMNLFHEIAGVACLSEEETNNLLKDIFRNLTGTMSDRAATMKSFKQKLADCKREILDSDEGLEFLFCNAHFLLGLSTAAEKTLIAFEEQMHWRRTLGRDRIPAFAAFRNARDAAACRLIRMACETLGPRGDAKSGCRDEWLAHCAAENMKSVFCSFRSNRFNNLFEGAAAVLHHRDHVINFFSNFKTGNGLNLKQKSVYKDTESKEILIMVTALAVVYVCVTGPFWVLVNSDTHYLDLHIHVRNMERHLRRVSETLEAVYEILTALPSCLETFFMEDSPLTTSVERAARELQDCQELHTLLQMLAADFLVVIQRQLTDFLPGGRYGQAPSQAQQEKMAHCKMTNLFGEANFGDLDLSLYNRRYCSNHHHSSINTLRRNKTVDWYLQQTSANRRRYLAQATSLGKDLRDKNREKEKMVQQETQQRLQLHHEQQVQKEAAKTRRILDITQKIQAAGGPCQSGYDVHRLLESCTSVTAKRAALQLQIQYQRLVLNRTSPMLIQGRHDLNTIVRNLCNFLDQQNLDHVPPEPQHPAAVPEENEDGATDMEPAVPEENEDGATDMEPEVEDSEEPLAKRARTEQLFTQQGETVAVYYDNCYYIGEVLAVSEGGETATVTFLSQVKKRNFFVWPEIEDIADVQAKFVIVWDVQLRTTNARTWFVTDLDAINAAYEEVHALQ